MAKKQLNISGKILSLILFVIVISLFGFGYFKSQEYQRQLSDLESKNSDLNSQIEDLVVEKDDLEYELDDLESRLDDATSNTEYYEKQISENFIIVESDIEYGLLKKYGLTHIIVPDENFETYELGQLRVKYRVKGYKEYSELLKARQKDYYMKYIMLLNAAYDSNGMDHFYDYYPY